MNKPINAVTAMLPLTDPHALSKGEMVALSAELILLNGFCCSQVLAVHPTERPDVWQVCCVADGAMDALVIYYMNVRTGVVTGR